MLTKDQLQHVAQKDQPKGDNSSSSSYSDANSSDGDDNAEVNPNLFDQQNFLFLFDQELKFSEREGFEAETDMMPQDYLKMKKVNR